TRGSSELRTGGLLARSGGAGAPGVGGGGRGAAPDGRDRGDRAGRRHRSAGARSRDRAAGRSPRRRGRRGGERRRLAARERLRSGRGLATAVGAQLHVGGPALPGGRADDGTERRRVLRDRLLDVGPGGLRPRFLRGGEDGAARLRQVRGARSGEDGHPRQLCGAGGDPLPGRILGRAQEAGSRGLRGSGEFHRLAAAGPTGGGGGRRGLLGFGAGLLGDGSGGGGRRRPDASDRMTEGKAMKRHRYAWNAFLGLALAFGACGGEPDPVDGGDGGGTGKAPPVASLEVSPLSLVVGVNEQRTIEARPLDAEGHPLDVPVFFTSADPNVALVSDTGVVTGRAKGQTLIQIRSGRQGATVAVTVEGRAAIFSVSPQSLKMGLGEEDTLDIALQDEDGQRRR